MTIDFKNQEALRALTTTLLHKDFGLRVEIPLNHLVPALPLRLNYLLWLEDLLHLSVKPREGQTRGVDIGTTYQHVTVVLIHYSVLRSFLVILNNQYFIVIFA